MMNDYTLHENVEIADRHFAIKIFEHVQRESGTIFQRHWHEQLELQYFKEGCAMLDVNHKTMIINKGDLVVINSNELHYGEYLQGPLSIYCIIIDTSLLQSSFLDACETKYILPITQNYIVFRNMITKNPEINQCIYDIFQEYEEKKIGYELSIKSILYRLLVLLLRNYVESFLKQKEHKTRIRNLKRLNEILKHIEEHFTEDLSIEAVAKKANISSYYFCRLFKAATGKTLRNYVNTLRMNKAEALLKDSDLNITETALAVGIDDANYFSRLYKKYKKIAPSVQRK